MASGFLLHLLPAHFRLFLLPSGTFDMHGEYITEKAILNHRLNSGNSLVKMHDVTHHQRYLCLPARFHHLCGILCVQCKRLLTENVLSRSGRRQYMLMMQIVRRGNDHGVDIRIFHDLIDRGSPWAAQLPA